MRTPLSSTAVALAALLLPACLSNELDPAAGGIYACQSDEDCPGEQSCLQGVCEAIPLPAIQILSPEDLQPFIFGTAHDIVLNVTAVDLVLRPLSESSEAVPGEGHLIVFIDEVEVDLIDSGDLTAGVQTIITIPDVPGAHRIRVQSRLNDGTDYDNDDDKDAARHLVWIDDGLQHVALRYPWPDQAFGLDSTPLSAQVEVFGAGITLGPPNSGGGNIHVHVYYDKDFPMCIDMPLCQAGYNGVVPSDDDEFGPVTLPDSGAGPATLTALIADADHTTYINPATMEPVFSSIQILRTAAP